MGIYVSCGVSHEMPLIFEISLKILIMLSKNQKSSHQTENSDCQLLALPTAESHCLLLGDIFFYFYSICVHSAHVCMQWGVIKLFNDPQKKSLFVSTQNTSFC